METHIYINKGWLVYKGNHNWIEPVLFVCIEKGG